MRGVVASIGRAAAQGRRWFVASTVLAATVAWLAPANAQLNILITKPAARPIPIALVPFGWQGNGPAAFDLAAVVTADLRSTGRFAPLPAADLVSRPTQPADVNFQSWRLLKTDYLVIGKLTEERPDSFTAVFELFDVVRGEQSL